MIELPSDFPPRPCSPRSRLAIALALTAGFLAVFILPYHIPVAATISESFLVGFNNRASLLCFLIFLAAFAWWSGGFDLRAPLEDPASDAVAPARSLLVAATCGALLYSTVEWLLQRNHPTFGEAIYFLDRLQHLNQGLLPYRQFEFPYGPLLLYLPWAVARLAHLSLADGYHLAWIAQTGVGIILIYACITLLPGRSARTKNVLFLLLLASWWASPITFGANYTAFRFFLAPFFCLLAARHLAQPFAIFPTALALLAAVMALLLVSPEQAIAFAGSIVAFLIVRHVQSREPPFLWLALLLGGGSAICFPIAGRLGLFNTLRAMGRGGYNLPLVPAPGQLPLFTLLIVAACVFLNTLRSRRRAASVEALILLGLFSLPAAFGRSDLGHFSINTTPAQLAAWVALAQYPRIFRPVLWSYILLTLLLPAPLILYIAVRAQHRNRTSSPTLAADAPGSQNLGANHLALVPLAPFARPLANSPSVHLPLAETGFYNGVELVTEPWQIEQKIQELRAHPDRELLLPDHFSCGFALDRQLLRKALLTPFVPSASASTDLREPLCTYIHLHYQASSRPSGLPLFSLWIPILPPSPSR